MSGPAYIPAGPMGPQQFPPQGPRPGVTADSLGDAIEPFLTSGGLGRYLVNEEFGFDPQAEGIQLVTSIYVPPGRVGWLKQIRVAPYIPPVLVDPWQTSGVSGFNGTWRAWAGDNPPVRAAANGGLWETPFAWESYFDNSNLPPKWEWHLRVEAGNVVRPFDGFDVFDSATWAYIEDIPVPRSAYTGSGVPGSPPSHGRWGPNRMQALPQAPLETHAMIPEDSTCLLFTTWRQTEVTPDAMDSQGHIVYGEAVFPLLPSFGQFHGYMQSSSSPNAQRNALQGWGG